ncbi:unnamed protein product, partial [Rotaria sordida]
MNFWCLVVQTNFVRTLASQQGKGPMDYVKQGVDQLGQAAEKVKEAVSNATSGIMGENPTTQKATNNFKNAPSQETGGSSYGSSSGSGTNNPSG